ncbi:hypothetical protein H206_05563 [Candidatus Electrothrix aarhusensis]|uniref:Uncharacterized protein n=1 Tax=Candidatus Electrothrix aarhusensis TaxID=1859131 RepID=A0A3S3QHU2_9BACT|nr:hypothetical protein H206_05563 [Candidatus Electrothrix aarhusensis]
MARDDHVFNQNKKLFIGADKIKNIFISLVSLFRLSYYVFSRVQLTRVFSGEKFRF